MTQVFPPTYVSRKDRFRDQSPLAFRLFGQLNLVYVAVFILEHVSKVQTNVISVKMGIIYHVKQFFLGVYSTIDKSINLTQSDTFWSDVAMLTPKRKRLNM